MSNKVKFNLEVEIEERWVNPFLSMLHRIQYDGHIGHSEIVGIFADGDGDFHFEFKADKDYTYYYPLPKESLDYRVIYDADYDITSEEEFREHRKEWIDKKSKSKKL